MSGIWHYSLFMNLLQSLSIKRLWMPNFFFKCLQIAKFSFNYCTYVFSISRSRICKGYLAFVYAPYNTFFVIYVCGPLITEYICMVHMYVHDVHMSGAGKWLAEGGDSRHSQFVSSKYRYFYIYRRDANFGFPLVSFFFFDLLEINLMPRATKTKFLFFKSERTQFMR